MELYPKTRHSTQPLVGSRVSPRDPAGQLHGFLARAAALAMGFLLARVDDLEEVDEPLLGHLKAVHDVRALDVLDILLEHPRELLRLPLELGLLHLEVLLRSTGRTG